MGLVLVPSCTSQVALVQLQRIVLPSIDNMRQVLEQKQRLARGPTPLERLDFITHISRLPVPAAWLVMQ
jgi:hypothetical protein